ncbi:hypothetical protein [Streptomyces nanshensis]|uniref:Secreted protein n=1 Tax=Streptomyces nanshensis TaxID=518642 RepID=A0A1E7LDG2_9ACTN|nr:hypothetical protein [Streptomyces nanshensis]OEV14184.1 hypothetical protein AN218_00325 [Streptomyces nanshensis]
MRKLREAAVVAAMVGSVGMLGAGVAAAGEDHEPPLFSCSQSNGGDNTEEAQNGLVGIDELALGGSGDATANTTQQVCGIGSSNNTNTGGDAESGVGGDGTIGLTL